MWILFLGILLYRYMPALKETNNLVLLQMDPNHVKNLKELNVVRAIFKVEANVDSHMEREDDINEINIKEKWNYILLTNHFKDEKEPLKFGEYIRTADFIHGFSIFPFTSAPLKVKIFNSILFIKGKLGKYVPSLVATFTPPDDELIDENELGHAIFSRENLNDNSPDFMVNIIKKNAIGMDKYENEVVWRMFPVIESRIFVGGTPDWPKSDSWDMIGLVQYKNRASLYKMYTSKEYKAVLPFKQKGLENTETYLTKQI